MFLVPNSTRNGATSSPLESRGSRRKPHPSTPSQETKGRQRSNPGTPRKKPKNSGGRNHGHGSQLPPMRRFGVRFLMSQGRPRPKAYTIACGLSRKRKNTEDNEAQTRKAKKILSGTRLLHPKYYRVGIRIRTRQEGIGNLSHGLRTASRDRATDTVGARLGSTDSAAPGGPWTKYRRRPGKRKRCRGGRQPWWSS